MSAYRLAGIPSNRLFILAAVVIGIALFAGGALSGRAMSGGDGERAVTQINFAQPSANGGNPAANLGDEILLSEEAKRGMTSSDMRYWAYCPGVLPAGLVNSVIDPGAAGVAMRLLGDGFELQSIALRSEGDCDSEGNATNVHPVLETNWLHTETGATVWVHQRASGETANYVDSYSALVWSGGYLFQLSVSGGWAMPFAEDAARATEGGGAGSSPGTTSMAAPALTEEDMAITLEAAIAQLAPDVAPECFYRIVPGGWDSLSALGLGDPRGAIPSDFTEDYINVRVLSAPAAGCDSPELDGYYGASFDASFTDGAGAWMGMSAYEVRAGETVYPGSSSAGSLNWSDGEWQYSVYGYNSDGSPIASVDLNAVASLLAPDFDGSCLAQDRILTARELEAAGFHAPAAPDGFAVAKSDLIFNGVPEGCEVGEDAQAGSYRLLWSLSDGAGTRVEISASRYEAPGDGATGGYVHDYGAGWTDAAGTSFNINVSNGSGDPGLDRDAIIALAQSVDPTLDPATLVEDGGIEPMPPKPATR